jgi:glycosyltransferase involved in cell wall biosynthesis
MNVLAVLHYPVFGGPPNRILRLSEPLAELGVRFTVVLPDEEGNAAERFASAGIPTERIRLRRARSSWNPLHHLRLLASMARDITTLRRIIRRLDPDVVLLTGLANPHAAIAGHLENRAVLWQIVDSRVPAVGRRVLMPFVARLSDTVMFWGSAIERLHTNGRRLEMPTMLGSSPVDLRRFAPSPERRARTRAELGIPIDAPVVGTVSNLNPQKGLEYFIRAARRIANEVDDPWFLVVGGRYDTHRSYAAKREAQVRESGLMDRFRFLGPAGEVENYYAAMDVKLITSVPASEGIPTTALEAMACGVPVVTTDVGSAAEAVVDGVTGYVVRPRDDAAIAAAALRILADGEFAAQLGRSGRQRAEERYGIEPSVELHMRAFRAAIEHRRSRSAA